MATFLTLPTSPDISPKEMRGPSAGCCDPPNVPFSPKSKCQGKNRRQLEQLLSLLTVAPSETLAGLTPIPVRATPIDAVFDPWLIPSTDSSTSSSPRTSPSPWRRERASPSGPREATSWSIFCARISSGAVLSSTPTPRGGRRSDISVPRKPRGSLPIALLPRPRPGPRKPSRSSTPHPRTATDCLLYTSPSPRDLSTSRMPSSA